MTHFWESYRCCPRCGTAFTPADFTSAPVRFTCAACGLEFYQNPKPATTVLIPWTTRPDHIVLMTRRTPPGLGQLALPGGMLEYLEQPEAGAVREAREEIEIDVTIDRTLDAYIVDYHYGGARVCIVEIVFLTQPIDADLSSISTSEASDAAYHDTAAILADPSRLAFPEQTRAISRYRAHLRALGQHAV